MLNHVLYFIGDFKRNTNTPGIRTCKALIILLHLKKIMIFLAKQIAEISI